MSKFWMVRKADGSSAGIYEARRAMDACLMASRALGWPEGRLVDERGAPLTVGRWAGPSVDAGPKGALPRSALELSRRGRAGAS